MYSGKCIIFYLLTEGFLIDFVGSRCLGISVQFAVNSNYVIKFCGIGWPWKQFMWWFWANEKLYSCLVFGFIGALICEWKALPLFNGIVV